MNVPMDALDVGKLRDGIEQSLHSISKEVIGANDIGSLAMTKLCVNFILMPRTTT